MLIIKMNFCLFRMVKKGHHGKKHSTPGRKPKGGRGVNNAAPPVAIDDGSGVNNAAAISADTGHVADEDAQQSQPGDLDANGVLSNSADNSPDLIDVEEVVDKGSVIESDLPAFNLNDIAQLLDQRLGPLSQSLINLTQRMD